MFGNSVNHPDKLAKLLLPYMVKFLYKGPELIAKLLPVCGLDVNFQLSKCQQILGEIIKQPSHEVLATVAGGNRVNQSFVKRIEIVAISPKPFERECVSTCLRVF